MVRAGKTLTVADIVEINRRMIAHFGGIFFEGDNNLAHRGSLEYVLAEIHGSLYGEELYPDLFRKQAYRLSHNSLNFWNKFRTGFQVLV